MMDVQIDGQFEKRKVECIRDGHYVPALQPGEELFEVMGGPPVIVRVSAE